MSLFKAKEFWTTTCDDETEEFDQNCLKITKLNSDSDYVITGSHSGVLRVFKPACELTADGHLGSYKATDLLIEKMLSAPILQVEAGRLVSGSNLLQLAILHPRNVSVYAFSAKEGATEHGTQHVLRLMYEHKLHRSAASFVIGPFGGLPNRDFICVQSLDGMLTFFEQEIFSFCCFLPDFLLAGALVYLPKSDVFASAGSDWQIHGYRYKQLSECGQNTKQHDDSGTKAVETWGCNIGEPVLDIKVIQVNNKEYVAVLGERTLFYLRDSGKILFMKRFVCFPLCFTTYSLGDEDRITTLIVLENNHLLVYQRTTLKWAVQLSLTPVAVARTFLKNIKGVIVLLTENGNLSCSYLGTEPSLFVAPPLNNREFDFEEATKELAQLNSAIKSAYSRDHTLSSSGAETDISLTASVAKQLQRKTCDDGTDSLMCELNVEIAPRSQLEEVQLTIFVQLPLMAVPDVFYYNYLSEKVSVQSFIHSQGGSDACSLDIDIVVTYTTNLGVPRAATCKKRLPLSLVMETCQTQKENEFKIVLSINQNSAPLTALFPEFAGSNDEEESSYVTNNSVAFKNKSGCSEPVTVLLAKSSVRYRLQCDSILPMQIVIEELIHRLKQHFAKNKDFVITCTSSLPIAQVLACVNKHFDERQKVMKLEDTLSQLGAQFRLIQKRLVAKFKAKNPTPLRNLELLLNDSYEDIIEVTNELEESCKKLNEATLELCIALNLILSLVRVMPDIKNVLGEIEATFCPVVYDTFGQNWEDTIDASLCFLLRTALAKTEKDKLRAPHTSFEEIKEISKVEKHLTQVLERISKREQLLETHFTAEENEREPPSSSTTSSVPENAQIGSEIGQSSSRILSARKSLFRKRYKTQNES